MRLVTTTGDGIDRDSFKKAYDNADTETHLQHAAPRNKKNTKTELCKAYLEKSLAEKR